jgi:hypothetical protein
MRFRLIRRKLPNLQDLINQLSNVELKTKTNQIQT